MEIKCVQCKGAAATYIEEDGRKVRHACYHCSMTGVTTYEEGIVDLRLQIAEIIARGVVSRHKQESIEHDNDWGLRAAESGISLHEYVLVEERERAELISKELEGLQEHTVEALASLLNLPKLEPSNNEMQDVCPNDPAPATLDVYQDAPPDDGLSDSDRANLPF